METQREDASTQGRVAAPVPQDPPAPQDPKDVMPAAPPVEEEIPKEPQVALEFPRPRIPQLMSNQTVDESQLPAELVKESEDWWKQYEVYKASQKAAESKHETPDHPPKDDTCPDTVHDSGSEVEDPCLKDINPVRDLLPDLNAAACDGIPPDSSGLNVLLLVELNEWQ